MTRAYGWNIAFVGMFFGAMVLIFTGGGVVFAGWCVKIQQARGRQDAVIRVSLAGGLLALPFAALGPLAPDGGWAAAALAGMCLGWGMIQPLAATAVQAIALNRLPARLAAPFQLLMMNIIAFVVGPTVVALVSDHIYEDPAKIGLALAIVSATCIPLGLLVLFAVRSAYARLVAEETSAALAAPLTTSSLTEE
ncbi:hypothetical protein [Sphingobium xenophagum]|uniref:hypothetical protein n=1 Tax=Sphingobium xenophagum TaxID=121428 RepID=UPI000477F0DF|nr:hypothetical protein [Sphingobium xenophagum]